MTFGRIIQQHGPNVCVLPETYLFRTSLARAKRQIPRMWSSYVMESRGLSEGIIVLWHRGMVKVDAFYGCEQHVAFIIFEQTSGPWLLSGVYASTEYKE